MADVQSLQKVIMEKYTNWIANSTIARGELTVEVIPEHLCVLAEALRTDLDCQFNMLVDVCGVDYLHYGIAEWETESATRTGFERGVDRTAINIVNQEADELPRFAAVYHLLSVNLNHRIRLRVRLLGDNPSVDSVISIWPSANWFEREAFDLYGIVFVGHPDLRRILTDYGFVGHPFRKDFPLSGKVEVRYDAALRRVIYEPVSIEPRILEPKVIRRDARYLEGS